MEKQVDVAIIGAGTSGLNVMGRVRRAGKSFVLINGGHTGTTCARVGCMPSKALIQVADDFHRRKVFPRFCIEGSEALKPNIPEIMEYVREVRDTLVDRVLGGSIDTLDENTFIDGYAEFIEPGVLKVNDVTVRAEKIVIATGSTPVVPGAWKSFGDRIVTTDNFFELEDLPESMAVIGLGVIGLELGQAISRLGVNVVGVDALDNVSGLTDPEINQEAINLIGKEFPLWLGHAAELEEAGDGRIRVRAGDNEVIVDKVLAAMGRRPLLDHLHLERLGVGIGPNSVPAHNAHTMQLADLPVYIVGDASGERAILHEAADEGKIAAFNIIAGKRIGFKRKVPLAITFSDPNIITVGTSWDELDQEQAVVGSVPLGHVGRALTKAKNRGLLRIYADKQSGRLLGGAMIGVNGENLAHLLAWQIQQESTVVDLLRMPFYHPVMEEALQAALRNVMGKLEMDLPKFVEVEPQ